MRFTSTASALVLGAAAVLAKELPKDELKAVAYDSGEVMEKIMMKKFVSPMLPTIMFSLTDCFRLIGMPNSKQVSWTLHNGQDSTGLLSVSMVLPPPFLATPTTLSDART